MQASNHEFRGQTRLSVLKKMVGFMTVTPKMLPKKSFKKQEQIDSGRFITPNSNLYCARGC